MIEELVKIHDKNSAEIKVGFHARKKKQESFFSLNMWMFIPNSLDINRFTYSKDDFYRDMKSNIRMITPEYILRDIAEGEHSAFVYLERSFQQIASRPTRTNKAAYDYQIKMFLSILKSSLREEVSHIIHASDADTDYLIHDLLRYTRLIAGRYRSLYRIINVPGIGTPEMDLFRFGDEFMTNTIEYHRYRLMEGLRNKDAQLYARYRPLLSAAISEEQNYMQEKAYPVARQQDNDSNSALVYRLGVLKKYAESQLFLNIDKRKDGVVVEQLLYSLAAGISMIFATVVAFSVQLKYGSYTMPLFVALVVSYMLKDRIKDFTRFYFAHKMGSRYFDHKITMKIHEENIGWEKESMDFISETKVPKEIKRKRDRTGFLDANNPATGEKVLLYRTRMYINRSRLDATSDYPVAGVNSIIRFNLLQLMRNMDDAEFPLFCPDDKDGFRIIYGEKLYYINLVMHKQYEEQDELVRYRIAVNRRGIQGIEKM